MSLRIAGGSPTSFTLPAPAADEAELKGKVEAFLEKNDMYQLPVADPRPDLSQLQQVLIRDSRPVDGDRVDAFLRQDTGDVYLLSTPSGFGGPMDPVLYGPVKLDGAQQPPSKVSQSPYGGDSFA